MWLAEMVTGAAGGHDLLGAAVAAGGDVPTSTIIAGVMALVSAVTVALISARGTLRTADVQREAEFDKRVDARLVRLEELRAQAEKRSEELYAELHRYRELYGQLRLDVMAAGLDPDNLGRRPSGETPPQGP